MSEYLVGPFGFLGTATAYVLAATLLMLLAGLRLGVRPSGFLTASCVLLGVVIISVCVSAIFPIDQFPQDGRLPNFTRAGIIHVVFAVPLFVSLIALLLILPSAYKRDEKWRSSSHVTLLLGFLTLASHGLAPSTGNIGTFRQGRVAVCHDRHNCHLCGVERSSDFIIIRTPQD